jgi:TonB family protein
MEKSYGGGFEIQFPVMIAVLRGTVSLGLFLCAAAWSQPGSAPVQNNDPPAVTSTAQDTPPSKPPEYKLEPIEVSNVAYPPQAREEKIEGEVEGFFWVSETGDVMNIRSFKGDRLLAKAADETVSKWKYKPVMSGNKALTVVAKVSLRFVLSDDDQRVNGVVPEIGSARRPQPVRVSEGVSSVLLVHKVKAVYPPEAKQAHIRGTVLLRVGISKEGRVANVRLVSGPKELAPAAISAVQQWLYKPYLLMGNPVELDTEVNVHF